MKRELKILTIDFQNNIKSDFDTSLKDSINSLSLTHSNWDKSIKLNEDFDIVFVYIDETKDPQRKISKIRSKLPLSEIIIVTNNEDFDLALFSLRNGVRDIISYPFEKDELNLSLKTAYSYRYAYFQSKKYSKMLGVNNSLGDIRAFKDFEDLFKRVYKLMVSFSPKVLFSVIAVSSKDECRVIYNSTSASKPIEVYKSIESELLNNTHYFVQGNIFCHEFAANEEERYFFVLKNYDEESFFVDESIRDYFFSVLRNSLEFISNTIKQTELTSLAHTDDVTGLYNQRKLYKDIDRNIANATKKNESFSLVFLDLDNFKGVNDGHGHLVGTGLLQQVSEVIRQVIRDTDYIYRYGGDEFVIILPTAKAEDARKIGERLLNMIKDHEFSAEGDKTFKLSTSIGIAEFPRDANDRKSILAIADKMMYEAKKTGRGRVCLIDEIFNSTDPEFNARTS